MQQYALLWSILIDEVSVCDQEYGYEWVCTVHCSVCDPVSPQISHIATKLILVMTNGCDIKETQIGVFTIFFITICPFMQILMTYMYIKHCKELHILGIIEK